MQSTAGGVCTAKAGLAGDNTTFIWLCCWPVAAHCLGIHHLINGVVFTIQVFIIDDSDQTKPSIMLDEKPSAAKTRVVRVSLGQIPLADPTLLAGTHHL